MLVCVRVCIYYNIHSCNHRADAMHKSHSWLIFGLEIQIGRQQKRKWIEEERASQKRTIALKKTEKLKRQRQNRQWKATKSLNLTLETLRSAHLHVFLMHILQAWKTRSRFFSSFDSWLLFAYLERSLARLLSSESDDESKDDRTQVNRIEQNNQNAYTKHVQFQRWAAFKQMTISSCVFSHLCQQWERKTAPSTMTIIVSIVIIMTSAMVRCYLFHNKYNNLWTTFFVVLFLHFYIFFESGDILHGCSMSMLCCICWVFRFLLLHSHYNLSPCFVHFFHFGIQAASHKKRTEKFTNSFSFDHKNKQCMHEYNTHNDFGLPLHFPYGF